MKNLDKSVKSDSNFDELVSKLSENEILNTEAMNSVRGGEGNGCEPIIITKF